MILSPAPGTVVVTVGEIIVDRESETQQRPGLGQQTKIRYEEKLGGCAVNAALGARSVPAAARFIGHCGTGPSHTALAGVLRATGVDLKLITRGTGAHTDIQLGPWAKQGPFLNFYPGDSITLSERDFSAEFMSDAGVLLLNSHHFFEERTRNFAFAAVDAAHAADVPILLDVSAVNRLAVHGVTKFKEDVHRIQPKLVLCNSSEFSVLMSGGGVPMSQTEGVVVHRDRKSTLVYPRRSVSFEVPVHPVKSPRRIVGAGDAFAGGLAGAMVNGAVDLRHGILLAHEAARNWIMSEPLTTSSPSLPADSFSIGLRSEGAIGRSA